MRALDNLRHLGLATVLLCAANARAVEFESATSRALDLFKFIDRPRIEVVGGEPVAAEVVPWQVGIVPVGASAASALLCGGSLISESWVVTAAHCAIDPANGKARDASEIEVIFATDDLSRIGGRVGVAQIIVHPRYVVSNQAPVNDIALFKLAMPVARQHIALVSAGSEPKLTAAGATVDVSGWGYTSEGARARSKTLQAARIQMVSREDCRKVPDYGGRVTDDMLCAAGPGKDACTYDSGGPLTAASAYGVQVLVGIVSWGKGCARRGTPGVYTRVASYLEWILSNTGPLPAAMRPPVFNALPDR